MRHPLLILAFVFHFHMGQSQTALEIIQRYIDTVSNGDIHNWHKIESMFRESTGFYNQREFDASIPDFSPQQILYIKTFTVFSPVKEKIEIYGDSTYSEFLSSTLRTLDELILEFNNMPPIIKRVNRDQRQASYFKPVEISDLCKDSRAITYTGVREFPVDGISCFEIVVETRDKRIGLYFNTRSYLLEYTNMFNHDEPYSDLSYVRYSNYRNIDGLLYYMNYYAMRNGKIFHSAETKRLQINYPIDPGKFQKR